jgi:hypothetical protein
MKPSRIDTIRRLILFAIFFVSGPLTSSRAQAAGTDVSGQNFVGDFYCEPSAIQVAKINGPILLLSGQDDQLGPCPQMANVICNRLQAKRFRHNFEHVSYP